MAYNSVIDLFRYSVAIESLANCLSTSAIKGKTSCCGSGYFIAFAA